MYRKIVLDNRLRIVAELIPTLKSVTIGIWVNVGSRDEQRGEEGLSHFLEHMFFKGTRSRSATQISREIDALGGEMNAFTTRETTTFYVKVLDQQLEAALELLSDLFYRSRFDSKEVEKEKQVVLEEIRMVQDDPEDLVQELHMKHTLGSHPLGRPILGQAPRIQALGRNDLLAYVGSHYDPERTVVAVAGNFTWRRLEQLLARYFSSSHKGTPLVSSRRPPEVSGGVLVKRKTLEQVHLCLGLQGLAAGSQGSLCCPCVQRRVGRKCQFAALSGSAGKARARVLDLFISVDLFRWRHDHRLCGYEAERGSACRGGRVPGTEEAPHAWNRCEGPGACEKPNEGQFDAQFGELA